MTVLLVGLASACLTRVATRDTITEAIREWFAHRLHGRYEVLVTCPWCLSAHITAIVFLATWHYRCIPLPALSFLAAWFIAKFGFWLTEALAAEAERE